MEKGSLEDRREIIEFHEKCKSLEEHNNNLEDQVNVSFEDFSYIEISTWNSTKLHLQKTN